MFGMQSIIFLEVDPEDVSVIRSCFPDAEICTSVLSGPDLITACKKHSIICCFIYSQFTAEVLSSLPNLRLLCTRSVGYNHLDVTYCRSKNITVCHVPDYGSHVIAEHAFALLLSALRHITEASTLVRGGHFDYHGLRGMALLGKTIGIVGTGKIGCATAKIAHGFGMRILATDVCRTVELEDRYDVRYVPFEELLTSSDIISLHIPATPETFHLIHDGTIAQMKKGVILLNTARGELIDSRALLRGLERGTIAHALLDVLKHETDTILNRELIQHPRVLVTPHIAFYADQSMQRMYQESFRSIHEFCAGRIPVHQVAPCTRVCDLPKVVKKAL